MHRHTLIIRIIKVWTTIVCMGSGQLGLSEPAATEVKPDRTWTSWYILCKIVVAAANLIEDVRLGKSMLGPRSICVSISNCLLARFTWQLQSDLMIDEQ